MGHPGGRHIESLSKPHTQYMDKLSKEAKLLTNKERARQKNRQTDKIYDK